MGKSTYNSLKEVIEREREGRKKPCLGAIMFMDIGEMSAILHVRSKAYETFCFAAPYVDEDYESIMIDGEAIMFDEEEVIMRYNNIITLIICVYRDE